jgi:hypothetical protein
MGLLVSVLDEVIARYAGAGYEAEAVRAREQFLEATGRVFDDDPVFEQRIAAFLEWYALERKMESASARPIDLYLREAAVEEKQRHAAEALAGSHWSLFQVLALTEGRAHLSDLIGGGRFIVHERRRLAGLDSGDVFEARLISDDGKTLFGRTFCFHPTEAVDAIRGYITQAAARGAGKQDVIFHLAERRMRCEQYHNVHVSKIYNGE